MSTVAQGATVPPMPAAETYRAFLVPPPEITLPCGDPVGVQEIAERLGLESRSVHMIGRRGQLPEPDYTTNGFRAWEWTKILWWAGETDRLRTSELVEEYRDVFGHGPVARGGPRPTPGVVHRVDDRPAVPRVPGHNAKAAKAAKAAKPAAKATPKPALKSVPKGRSRR